MSTTILAPIVLTVLGIIFGTILAVASKVFAVEKDPLRRYRDLRGRRQGRRCGVRRAAVHHRLTPEGCTWKLLSIS